MAEIIVECAECGETIDAENCVKDDGLYFCNKTCMRILRADNGYYDRVAKVKKSANRLTKTSKTSQ